MQDPAEPVMEVVLLRDRTGSRREVPRRAGPVGIDVTDWRRLSERIADHEDVRL